MNTIIFGCGNIGRWTLGFIGKERVDYFCDNNSLLIVKYVEGIEVISYEELLKLYNKDDALKLSFSLIEKEFNDKKIHTKEKIIESYLLEYNEDNEYYYFKYMIKKIINITEFKCVNLEDN